MRTLCRQIAVIGLLISGWSYAQIAKTKTAPGEFPAVALLPPGTVVEGIKLPRYEGARVTALIQAKNLQVLSRNEVSIEGLLVELYGESGHTTSLSAEAGKYDFRVEEVRSSGRTSVHDPRFRAQGAQLLYSTTQQRGHLRGPVRTIISRSQPQPTPAPAP